MMKRLSKHIMYPLIERAAHGSTFKCLKILEQTQWLSAEKLKSLQEEQLRQLIAYAYQNVPYYRKVFEERYLFPTEIKTIEDLHKLPILTRREVQDNLDTMTAQNYSGRMRKTATGGTTGEPIRFYRPREEGWTWGAFYRGLRWYRFEPGDKVAQIWGGVPHGSLLYKANNKITSFLERRVSLSAFDQSEEKMSQFAAKLKAFQPEVIIAYSSAVHIFADYLRHRGIQDIRPKVVVTSAEKLLRHQRQSIKEAFGCDVFEYYGCGEVLSIAYECPEHQGYHISAEKVIVETVRDDGSPCKPGELGRIIVTDLYNYAMPFIRYAVGDEGILAGRSCPCGRGLPLLKSIEGRTTDYIVLGNGERVSGLSLTDLCASIEREQEGKIREYQIIQEITNEISVKVVKGPNYISDDTLRIMKMVRKRVGEDFEVKVEFVDTIPMTRTGKKLLVISKVPPGAV